MSTTRVINKIVYVGAVYGREGAITVDINISKNGKPVEVRKDRIINIIERECDISGCAGIFNYLVASYGKECATDDADISAWEILQFRTEIAELWKHDLRNDLYDSLLYYMNDFYGNGDNAGNMFDEIEEFLNETKGITEANVITEDHYTLQSY
jgi:hypothetical protein